MIAVVYAVKIENPDRLIMPFRDLIDALGRSPIDPHPCSVCGRVVLCGSACVSCLPNVKDDRAAVVGGSASIALLDSEPLPEK